MAIQCFKVSEIIKHKLATFICNNPITITTAAMRTSLWLTAKQNFVNTRIRYNDLHSS
jgi:hypothetical protein